MNRHSLIAHGIRMLLPFSERIAVRMMVVSAASFAGLAAVLVLGWTHAFGTHATVAVDALMIALMTVFLASFTAFIALFAGFGRSQHVAAGAAQTPSSLSAFDAAT